MQPKITPGVALAVMLVLSATPGCGAKHHDDNRDGNAQQQQIDALQQQLKESESARAAAEKAAAADKTSTSAHPASSSTAAPTSGDAGPAGNGPVDAHVTADGGANADKTLADANASVAKLTNALKTVSAENASLAAAAHADTTLNIVPFAGIWVADGDEDMKLADGCRLIYRVDAKPATVLRAIACINGSLELSTASVAMLATQPSRFAGGFQLNAIIDTPQTSCVNGAVSTFAPQTNLAFDLKTAAGGDAATFAYTHLGDQEIALHSAGAIDDFARNADCATIITVAKDASLTDPLDFTLRLAAKVCQVKVTQGGCYTQSGYVAPAN